MTMNRTGRNSRHRIGWSLFVLSVLMIASLVAVPVASAQESKARDFFGTILSVSDDILQVSTKDGDMLEVTVTDDTSIVLPLDPNGTLDDLFEGDVVAISLVNTNEPLVAAKIFVVSTQTRHKHISGTVTAKTDTSITIDPLRDGSDTITFNITLDTKINLRGGAIALDVGSFVIVVAVRDSNSGELSPNAIEINVAPTGPATPSVGKPVEDPSNKARIRGVFQEITSEGNWIVNDTTVVVDNNTEIESGLVIGQIVEISGQLLEDDSILAREIEAEEEHDDVERLRFEGVVKSIDGENWNISGTTVIVRHGIDIDGRPSIGQRVRVKAIVMDDGAIIAREIQVVRSIPDDDDQPEERRLEGKFQGVDEDGKWIIGGVKVAVDEDTRLEDAPEIGDRVKVEAILLDDGTLLAREIEVEDREEDPGDFRKKVEFRGVIQRVIMEGDTIVGISVRGRRVEILELTEVRGALRVGLLAKVEAVQLPDGSLIAKEIETRRSDIPGLDGISKVEIKGVIQRMNDDGSLLQVNGITVANTLRTRVEGELAVGVLISVEGILNPDGTVLAQFIKGFAPVESGDRAKEEVRGVIDEMIRDEDGNIIAIVVDGTRIRIEALTEIDSALRLGSIVEIEGFVSDGGLLAEEVEEEELDESREGQSRIAPGAAVNVRVKFEGTIEAMERGGNQTLNFIWVQGEKVAISPSTEVKGDRPAIGHTAEVEGRREGNLVIATKIEVEAPDVLNDSRGNSPGTGSSSLDNDSSNSGRG